MTIKELIASKLRPIGDAIREKDGSTELIPIDDMPQAIRDIKGGRGIVEVTELPEVGEEDVMYKLFKKPVAVPNTGYVERVYLNKSLTFDEVNAICTKANNLVANETLKVNCILDTKDNSKVLTVMKFTETDDSTFNVILYPDWLTVIWAEKDFTSSDGTMNCKKGWNIEQDYLEINAEVVAVSEDDIPTNCGAYNDQLTELFSLNGVFETTEEYFIYEKLPPLAVPTSGTISKVYINPIYTSEEMRAIIEKYATVELQGLYVYPIAVDINTGKLLCMFYSGSGFYTIGVLIYDGSLFTLDASSRLYYEGIDKHEAVFNESGLELNWTTVSNAEGIPIGSKNSEISNLISITPDFSGTGQFKQISGGFKTVDALPSVGNENYTYVVKAKSTFKLYSDITGAGLVDMEEFASQMGMAMELVAVVDSPDQLPTDNIKISNGETEMFFYYVRNYGLYVYGPFSGDGNSWMNTSSMMPFSGEITKLDEVIVKDTVYVLVSGGKDSYYIYDNKLKPFPNKGTISEIYFNTSLSVDEVVAELSKLTLDEDGIYVLGGSLETPCLLYITYHETAGWTIQDVFKNNYFFISEYSSYLGFEGWNHNLIKDGKYTFDEPIKLLTYNDDGDIVGSENWKITNVVRVFDNKWTKISGANIVSKGGTVVPNSGYVEKVYFNTSKDYESYYNLFEQLDYIEYAGSLVYPVLFNPDVYMLYIKKHNSDGIVDYGVYYQSLTDGSHHPSAPIILHDGDLEIWSPDFIERGSYVEVNNNVINNLQGINIGLQNDLLRDFVSLTPSFDNSEVIKELSGEYDGTTIFLSNKIASGSTVVPNSGYVDMVYYNYNLTIEETNNILSQLTYVQTPLHKKPIAGLLLSENSTGLIVVNWGDGYEFLYLPDLTGSAWVTLFNSSATTNTSLDGWDSFWETEEAYRLLGTFEANVLNDFNGIPVGAENNKLINLISITPFEVKTVNNFNIDIKSMLEEKKLPLSINVNIESVNIVKSNGTAVPNSGYVEKIYFNTSKDFDSYYYLFEKLNLVSGYPILLTETGKLLMIRNTQDDFRYTLTYTYSVSGTIIKSIVSYQTTGSENHKTIWNTDFISKGSCIEINENVIAYNPDFDNIGLKNDLLRGFVSTTPFENQVIKELSGDYEAVDLEVTENTTIDVSAMLDEGKMPMSVTVNVKGVELNPVTNIALSSGGLLTWDAPDTTDIADKLVSISYVVNVNGTELTSDTNSISVIDNVVVGENTVIVKAIVSLYNEETQSVVEYEAPAEPVAILLEIKLPTGLGDTSAVSIGTNAYIFGGYLKGYLNQILKFDTTTETVTTLSAVLPSNRGNTSAVSIGTNAYIFGGLGTVKLKDILKFDSVSETVTTLSAVLPFVLMTATAVSIETNAYIFGGVSDSNSNQILKFDSVSETVTTLSAVLPKAMYDMSAVSIGTNAYIFGGRISVYSGSKDILKFDSVSETVTTLSALFSHDSYDTSAVSIETNAYIFGGHNSSIQILKFDSVSETVTTLSAVLPSGSFNASAVSIGTNAYIFGGYLGGIGYLDTIIKVSNL